MSILNVDKIQPIGGGSTITVDATDIQATSATITASSFVGSVTGTASNASNASNASGATGDFSIVDKIVHTGDTDTTIRFPAADTITAETGGTERLRIGSNGYVNIGTGTAQQQLTVQNSAQHSLVRVISSPTAESGIDFGDTDDGDQGKVRYNNVDSYMKFEVGGNSEKLRITSDGRVSIGATSGGNPDTDDLVISGSGKRGITVCSTNGSECRLTFADGLSGVNAVAGNITYTHSNDSLDLYTATTRRVRIDSSGRELINTTTATGAAKLQLLQASGDGLLVRNHDTNYEGIILSNASGEARLMATSGGSTARPALTFFSADGERLRIRTSGQVEFKNGSFSDNVDCVMANGGTMEIGAQSIIKFRTATNERLQIRADGRTQIKSGDFEVIGGEGGDAQLRLTADEGDDGADYWRLESKASNNNLNIASYASGAWVDKLILDSSSNLKQGTTPTAFTGSAPNVTTRFLGKKCLQGSVTSTATLAGNGTGTFDLGRLWITDDSSTELFIQVMRNDSANYTTHYCKAFINKVRGTGMAQGHILYQNGAASGYSVTGIQAGGYTASGGSSHGTQITVSGGAGGVIYRMTCFFTTISKNDMW